MCHGGRCGEESDKIVSKVNRISEATNKIVFILRVYGQAGEGGPGKK